jgi:(p)ppGpp synthase/HD superfamily hydrolase
MVRYWLLGRGYTTALEAMEFAASHHTGLRKDGSPEFSHQVWQVAYARTLVDQMLFPEETLSVIFLHDVVEDYPVGLAEIESLFGEMICGGTDRMSKVIGGVKKKPDVYFGEMSLCPISSIAKGVDRTHNHHTMKDAFSAIKQEDYLGETEADILPMLKAARRRFPGQEPVYENIKHMLISQIELYRYALAQQSAA